MKHSFRGTFLVLLAGLFAWGVAPASAQVSTFAPDFELPELSTDVKYKLSNFNGQPVMLNFFATWCGPCHAEAPDLLALYQEYSAKGVQFLEITSSETSTTKTTWYDGVKNGWKNRHQIPFPILVDANFDGTGKRTSRGAVYAKYGDGYIPYNVVISPQQTILYQDAGYNESAIRNALDAALDAMIVKPGQITDLAVSRTTGNFVHLAWSAPTGGAADGYRITWGGDKAMSTIYGQQTVTGSTSLDLQLSDTSMVYYLQVVAFNRRGDGAPSSAQKFAFKPYCEMLVNDTEVRAGDRLTVSGWWNNGGDSTKSTQVYYLLDIAGTIYFFNPALEFTQAPIFTLASIQTNTPVTVPLLDVTFEAGNPLPDAACSWYMGLVSNSNFELYDLVAIPFAFRP